VPRAVVMVVAEMALGVPGMIALSRRGQLTAPADELDSDTGAIGLREWARVDGRPLVKDARSGSCSRRGYR
jgi:hypothetical protein